MYKSNYNLVDEIENLSICYNNIYYINGQLKYLTTKNENLPYVNKWPNSFRWKPELILFDTEDDISKYVLNLQNLEHIELAAFCDMVWAHNIGHGLFDGLYPIYLALVKFNYINDNFTLIINNWENDDIMMCGIVNIFSGSKLLDKNKTAHISKLVAGSGVAGNCSVNKNYQLYGSKYNGIKYFRERMLTRYKIDINISINDKLNIVIIDNKRYSQYEKNILKQVISHYSHIFNIKYIDWRSYSSFEEQLKEISNVDIQITGPGTGMLYIPFLKNNSVNINLGYIEHIPNYSRCNIIIENSTKEFIVPGWMEQSICSGCEHVNTIYYDRMNYNNIEFSPMIDIIDKAVSIINGDIKLDTNLNVDAQIFKKYCSCVDNYLDICENMMNRSFYADVNLFVNEHPYAAPKNIVDIELLRKIKNEFNYDQKYLII